MFIILMRVYVRLLREIFKPGFLVSKKKKKKIERRMCGGFKRIYELLRHTSILRLGRVYGKHTFTLKRCTREHTGYSLAFYARGG